MTIQLSNISPDFDSIRLQLEQAAGQFPSWKDRITGATGQTILEMVAAIAAYSQYSIESSYQESWPDSAKNPESLYAAANYAGVRINRRSPASLTFNMVAGTSRTIPPYTQFVGAGTYWFNRTPLSLSTTPSAVTLHQGQIVQKQMFGLGTDFQAFVSDESNFSVSDTDVVLTINSVSIPVIREGLWTCPSLPGVQQFTLPDGKMIVLFGNALYGSKPGTNDICSLKYVVTAGQDANNIAAISKQITMDGVGSVRGTPTSNPANGAPQSDFLVYKNITPALFGAFDSAVTAQQYKKYPLLYPGVIDARVLAQREINPKALNFMNTMKVCLLTSQVWGDPEWNAFEDWFNRGTMYSTRIIREDPTPVNIAVTAKISCKNYADLNDVKIKVESALNKLFAKRQGSIGLDLYKSDILAAMRAADSNIEFIEMSSPGVDVILSSLSVGTPSLAFVPGGTLPPGTYDYAVGLVSTLGGTVAPAKWRTITTTQTGSIQITWPMAANPALYQIFGRVTGGAMGLITSVAAAGTALQSYTDTGSVTPTGSVPFQSTIASYYPNLVAKNLTLAYTMRNIRD